MEDRVALGPLEVDVRPYVGAVAEVENQRGERVRGRGCLDGQHAVLTVQHLAVDADLALEVGVVLDRHLHEDDVAGVGQVVVVDDLADLGPVLLDVPVVRLSATTLFGSFTVSEW